jgi:ADP-ribose pyrophosphatase YjhB (NUDIX family)
MTQSNRPDWLLLARELQALAQTGLGFTEGIFDRERYRRVGEIAAIMLADGSGMAPDKVMELLQFDKGYATPKIGVRGAVIRDNRILLVRETSDGKWAMPGGWCDPNQTVAACIEREIREETGYTARATKLLALLDHSLHHPPHMYYHYVAFFACEIVGGEQVFSIETDAIDFFAPDALPPLSPGRTTIPQVEMAFRHWREPSLAAEFDRS